MSPSKLRVTREEQDLFGLHSQEKAAAAQASGRFTAEIVPVTIAQKKGDSIIFDADEHPRPTSLEALTKLKPVVRPDGTVTAGNASGLNDSAAAMLVASEAAAKAHGLTPRARIVAMASAGVAPRIMGIGPIAAASKLFAMTGLTASDLEAIELNEAFASQVIATLRELDIPPTPASIRTAARSRSAIRSACRARITLSAAEELQRGERYALAFICVGVRQGIGVILERV